MTEFLTIAAALAFIGLGILTGIAHLKLLMWHIRALTGGLHGIAAPAALAIRAGPTIAAFAYAAIHGAMPLTAMLAGFLLTRTVLIRRGEMLVS